MNVEIRDGVKIVRHATGVVDIYGIVQTEQFRDMLIKEKQDIQANLDAINADIAAMRASQKPKIIKRIINKLLHKTEV